MSDGKTHLLVNSLCSVGITLGAILLHLPAKEIYPLASGMLLGTTLITPDLDMPVRTVALKFWGPLGFIWWPVLKLSKHRGRSHTYVQGPIFRLAYVALIFSPLLYYGITYKLFRPTVHEFLYFFGGYLIMQWIHLFMDNIKPSLRRI